MKLFGYKEAKSRSKEASLLNKNGESIVDSWNGDGWHLDMVFGEALDTEVSVVLMLVVDAVEKSMILSVVLVLVAGRRGDTEEGSLAYAQVSDLPLQRVQRGNLRSHFRFAEAHSAQERRWEWGFEIFDIVVES